MGGREGGLGGKREKKEAEGKIDKESGRESERER